MPRYLRYISAASVAITVYFILAIALGVAFIGAGDTPKPLNGAVGLLVALLAQVGPVLSALVVNDWLRTRYPVPSRSESRRETTNV